ncbi:MAG TPA: trehalose-6-phosphate synthase [Caulobacteraceae bacterium]|nr:trehalose-6-phosphate synthase [Caulobacteraceae bacterium]
MSRLIVVSNRVVPPDPPGEAQAGGLAVAIAGALEDYSGFWFGWSGEVVPKFAGKLRRRSFDRLKIVTLDLEEADYEEYYNGFANGTLWPLFHYRIDLTAYDRSFSEGYERVNRRFAEALAPLVEPGDLIWVHDYHLIPLGRELRRLGIANPIGFFLHIPWPAPQLLTTLPRNRQLVQSLFSYDLVGFQSDEWLWAFESYVLGEADGRWAADGRLEAFGASLRAQVFPIGLDTKAFQKLARSSAADQAYDRMAAHSVFRSLIVGVDRLDYSKGLEERLLGFERFLQDHPEYHREVLYLQVAPTSRGEMEAYQDLRERVDTLCGRINGAFSDMDWAPIRHVHQSFNRDELAGVYRAARVCLVTPLRDGMNLVAKEFVAAQNPDDPGVLILSRFTGAARQMSEAVIVNPFSREELSEALHTALSMERDERVGRWKALMEGVRRNDVTAWRDNFVEALRSSHQPKLPLIESSTRSILREAMDGPPTISAPEIGELPRQASLRADAGAERQSAPLPRRRAPLRHPET